MIAGNANRRMTLVVGRQEALVVGFPAVVEFFKDPVPELGDQPVDILAGCGDPQHPAQQRDIAEVSRHGLGDPRVLHLYRDGAAIQRDRAVHLADRGGRDRLRVPAGEGPLWWQAKLLRDYPRRELSAHRRDTVLQAAHGATDTRRQAVVDVAGHLAELHQHALHRPQRVGHVFGGLQGEIVAQLFPVLPGGREQPGRAAGVAHRTAPGELQRRKAAVKSQPPDPAAHHEYGRDKAAGDRGGSQPLNRKPPHASRADRIRRVIRCRASSTPGSPRNTASRMPSACRISLRRSGVRSSGAT